MSQYARVDSVEALKLFRLALQHLLLPLLFGSLGAVALLLGQIRLAPGQFVELLQRIGDFLLPLFGGSAARDAYCATHHG